MANDVHLEDKTTSAFAKKKTQSKYLSWLSVFKEICLLFVGASLCENLIRPAKLIRWVIHVLGHLVLVIV